MAATINRLHRFNLIEKELEMQEAASSEKDWYVLMNISIVSLCIILATLAFFFRSVFENKLESKKSALVQNINSNLNISAKSRVEDTILKVQERYDIYKNFKGQNLDFEKFYSDMTALYPDIQVRNVVLAPNVESINIEASIPQDGYKNMPDFLQKMESNESFKSVIVDAVEFEVNREFLEEGSSTYNPRVLNGRVIGPAEEIIDPNKQSLIYNIDDSKYFVAKISMTINFKTEADLLEEQYAEEDAAANEAIDSEAEEGF